MQLHGCQRQPFKIGEGADQLHKALVVESLQIQSIDVFPFQILDSTTQRATSYHTSGGICFNEGNAGGMSASGVGFDGVSSLSGGVGKMLLEGSNMEGETDTDNGRVTTEDEDEGERIEGDDGIEETAGVDELWGIADDDAEKDMPGNDMEERTADNEGKGTEGDEEKVRSNVDNGGFKSEGGNEGSNSEDDNDDDNGKDGIVRDNGDDGIEGDGMNGPGVKGDDGEDGYEGEAGEGGEEDMDDMDELATADGELGSSMLDDEEKRSALEDDGDREEVGVLDMMMMVGLRLVAKAMKREKGK
ncbi:hypothetical protein BGX23_012703 [Mortierella sp. AD031]|nr:hypothetical protein BGX23_012703 [Mortierella sp. AD031]